jgi:release factor glutamine methyltransferase
VSTGPEAAGAPRTLLEILQRSTRWLSARGVENARREAEELLARSLSCRRMDLYLQHDRPLEEQELRPLRSLLSRRAAGEPLQYLLGSQPFRSAEITVDSRVLIPRPETEQLVERALAALPAGATDEVLDIGTGSGCIAISLALERPGLRICAVDSSPGALGLAAENARLNGVAARIEFRRLNILRELPDHPVDLLISNPPYVSPAARGHLQPELAWEPVEALFGPDDGLGFYRRFAGSLASLLKPGGAFHFEIGEDQGGELLALFAEGAVDLELGRDWSGRVRFLSGRRAR